MIAAFLFIQARSFFRAMQVRLAAQPGVAGPCGRCESDGLDRQRMLIVARYGVDLAPRTRTARCAAHRTLD